MELAFFDCKWRGDTFTKAIGTPLSDICRLPTSRLCKPLPDLTRLDKVGRHRALTGAAVHEAEPVASRFLKQAQIWITVLFNHLVREEALVWFGLIWFWAKTQYLWSCPTLAPGPWDLLFQDLGSLSSWRQMSGLSWECFQESATFKKKFQTQILTDQKRHEKWLTWFP